MNKIAENALNRVFEPEEKPVRQGWREAFEKYALEGEDELMIPDVFEDEDEYKSLYKQEDKGLTYDDGVYDYINDKESRCQCDNCNYCRGYTDAYEDDEIGNEEELDYDDGIEDAQEGNERACDCGECDYCKGYEYNLNYTKGRNDCIDESKRKCNCNNCDYCNGWNYAMTDSYSK